MSEFSLQFEIGVLKESLSTMKIRALQAEHELEKTQKEVARELREIVWKKTMSLTIEMSYSKSKYLKGKYDAFKEIWEELGGDIEVEDSSHETF